VFLLVNNLVKRAASATRHCPSIFGSPLALDLDLRTFLDVLADNFGQTLEEHHATPSDERWFLWFPVFAHAKTGPPKRACIRHRPDCKPGQFPGDGPSDLQKRYFDFWI